MFMEYIIESVQSKKVLSGKWRGMFIWISLVVILGFILFNLIDLQIIHGEENLIKARNISKSEKIVRAPRGLIFDSNGEVLAQNVASYSVYIDPDELTKEDEEFVINKLASILGVSFEQVFETYREAVEMPEDTRSGKVTISNDVTDSQYVEILVQQDSLSGVYTQEDPKRFYPFGGTLAHLIGYVSDINQAEVEATGLDENANIGKEGIEKSFDEVLRGEDGISLTEVYSSNNDVFETLTESPDSGKNLYLTLNIDWQRKLQALLDKRIDETDAFGGVAIIMESETGKIRGMVNYPTYDNNLFAKGISAKDFSNLNNDSATPLLNRAIALQLPTGSIFKPIVASTALEEQVITPATIFKSGCVELPLYKLCEADNSYLGEMTVVQALGRSSNVFFCKTGLEMVEKAEGIRTLMKYADEFGIGRKTGVDIPGEQSGTMASPELKEQLMGEPWYLADICNTVIGQGLVTATPLQMVSVASTISNDGEVVKPQLIDRIEDQSGKVIQRTEKEVIRQVSVSAQNFAKVKEGMNYAVNGERGSASGLRGLPGNPYAKTGSADAAEYRDGKKVEGAHSWVMGGFEYKGTDYSFVVHLQEGGRGYQSVPVIKDFINWLNS